MARSFFVFYSGLAHPSQFKAGQAPPLLALQDLWDVARNSGPALIFRVRSESKPGEPLAPEDVLESCVGMIDSATRWRTVFNMTRTAINAVRHPVLKEACFKAMQFISTQHPANVTPDQRLAILGEIMKIAAGQIEEGGDKLSAPHPFEAAVAETVAMMVQADNDHEAAQLVPFVRALCPFEQFHEAPKGAVNPAFAARMGTLDTMAGAVLLTEAANRLSERLPAWLFAKMPELGGAAEKKEAE